MYYAALSDVIWRYKCQLKALSTTAAPPPPPCPNIQMKRCPAATAEVIFRRLRVNPLQCQVNEWIMTYTVINVLMYDEKRAAVGRWVPVDGGLDGSAQRSAAAPVRPVEMSESLPQNSAEARRRVGPLFFRHIQESFWGWKQPCSFWRHLRVWTASGRAVRLHLDFPMGNG